MLVLDIVINIRLKILNIISVESMECLNKKERRKKHFLYIGGRIGSYLRQVTQHQVQVLWI